MTQDTDYLYFMFSKKISLHTIEKSYQRYAPIYEKRWASYLLPMRRWVFEHFEEGESLLSLGCGTGQFLAQLESTYSMIKITGIDASSDMLEIAKKNLPKAKFLKQDLETLTLLAKSYDVILCLNVLHFINNPQRLIQQIEDALTNNGVAYIGDYAIKSIPMRMAELYWRLFDKTHHKAYTVKEMKALFTQFDIEQSSYLRTGWFWRLQVYKLRKKK